MSNQRHQTRELEWDAPSKKSVCIITEVWHETSHKISRYPKNGHSFCVQWTDGRPFPRRERRRTLCLLDGLTRLSTRKCGCWKNLQGQSKRWIVTHRDICRRALIRLKSWWLDQIWGTGPTLYTRYWMWLRFVICLRLHVRLDWNLQNVQLSINIVIKKICWRCRNSSGEFVEVQDSPLYRCYWRASRLRRYTTNALRRIAHTYKCRFAFALVICNLVSF
jgi:hypothetical protein